MRNWVKLFCILLTVSGALAALATAHQRQTASPKSKIALVHSQEPPALRRVLVGPGVNEPSFPGYYGFVGWESPLRLRDGTWLVAFNAGYYHASYANPWSYAPIRESLIKLGFFFP